MNDLKGGVKSLTEDLSASLMHSRLGHIKRQRLLVALTDTSHNQGKGIYQERTKSS